MLGAGLAGRGGRQVFPRMSAYEPQERAGRAARKGGTKRRRRPSTEKRIIRCLRSAFYASAERRLGAIQHSAQFFVRASPRPGRRANSKRKQINSFNVFVSRNAVQSHHTRIPGADARPAHERNANFIQFTFRPSIEYEDSFEILMPTRACTDSCINKREPRSCALHSRRRRERKNAMKCHRMRSSFAAMPFHFARVSLSRALLDFFA